LEGGGGGSHVNIINWLDKLPKRTPTNEHNT